MKDSKDGNKQEHAATEDQNNHRAGRRTYLKLAGTALASVSAAVVENDAVRAASDGYGSGGYGEGPYRGEDGPVVSTQTATNIGTVSAILNGSLDDLGSADSADRYFEWREEGTDS